MAQFCLSACSSYVGIQSKQHKAASHELRRTTTNRLQLSDAKDCGGIAVCSHQYTSVTNKYELVPTSQVTVMLCSWDGIRRPGGY